MREIRSILLVVEPDHRAARTVAKAGAIARCLGAPLELFLCDSERGYWLERAWDQSPVASMRCRLIDANKQYLEVLAGAITSPDLKVNVDASCDTPSYAGIVQKIRNSHSDLVLKAMGSSDSPKTSDTDWQLIRTCPAPLLLMQEYAWRSTPRIAASVDMSSGETPGLAQRLIDAATSLASTCCGQVDLLYGRSSNGRSDDLTALGTLADSFCVPRERVHVLAGDPSEELPRHASCGRYDLIVLGALGHDSSLPNLVGSLTDRLLEALDCDFLLLKPDDYVSPVQSRAA
jgi:universal stress protein E